MEAVAQACVVDATMDVALLGCGDSAFEPGARLSELADLVQCATDRLAILDAQRDRCLSPGFGPHLVREQVGSRRAVVGGGGDAAGERDESIVLPTARLLDLGIEPGPRGRVGLDPNEERGEQLMHAEFILSFEKVEVSACIERYVEAAGIGKRERQPQFLDDDSIAALEDGGVEDEARFSFENVVRKGKAAAGLVGEGERC